MSQLRFYIRHNDKFIRDKFILVFKSERAKQYFESKLQGSYFEEVSSESAIHAARIGINGKIIPYGYTTMLTEEEKKRLSITNWEETAELLAEGNERLYKKAMEKEMEK